MKRGLICAGAMLLSGFWMLRTNAQTTLADEGPKFGAKDELRRPDNYREWVWLSSGLGMTYMETATREDHPNFDNVFVNPSAYRAFQKTGEWPDHTMLILEVRASGETGSINKGGRYQTELRAIEVHVKDERRLN